MSKQTYDQSLDAVLRDEGGYTNDPSDPGGPTNWGITIADARMYWKPDATAEDVKRMPVAVAKDIFRSKYWDAQRCDDLQSGVDYAVFDYGVNSGIRRSAKVLQRIVGAKADGKIGLVTVTAARAGDAHKIIDAIYDERLAFLKSLKTWPVFGRGWGARCSRGRTFAHALANQYPTETLAPPAIAATPEPPISTPASGGAKAVEPDPVVKPVTQSKTILGGILAWLSGNGGLISTVADKLDNPFIAGVVVLVILLSTVGLYLVIKGRIDVQKVLHQVQDQT